MKFFRELESDIKYIAQKFLPIVEVSSRSSDGNLPVNEFKYVLTKIEKVEKLIDKNEVNPVAKYSHSQEVQNAINYFNSLPAEDKNLIIDEADTILQNKLMLFMEDNAKFSDNIDTTKNLLNISINSAKEIYNKNKFTEKELAYLLKYVQVLVAKCNIEADRVINAFLNYRGSLPMVQKIFRNNNDEYAIGSCSSFKKEINGELQIIRLCAKKIFNSEHDDKQNLMTEIINHLENIEIKLDNFQSLSTELMNSFIPMAIESENLFSRRAQKYINIGIDINFSFENKLLEKVLIDSLLNAVSMKSAA